MAEFKGIDVSKHQGKIDWRKVANTGIKFAMIRASYGWDNPDQVDKYLAENVAGCEANGIHYGFYHYSYATTPAEAKKEAEFFIQTIRKYKPSMPLVYDIEDASQEKLGKEVLTDMCLAFCTTVEAWGYYAAIYASLNWLRNLLDMKRLSKIDVWLAQWAKQPTYTGDFGMWQYSATGKVDGIQGNVDMNIAYVDYPALIKKAGLNGWTITHEEEKEPPAETVPIEQYNALQAKYDALAEAIGNFIKSVEGRWI